MVKFMSFDLYDRQNLLPPQSLEDDEPMDVISALNDDFLLSTKNGEIIHYVIGATNECSVLNRFNTQYNQILSLSYIATNDTILTLERNGEMGVIRVYQNWRQNQSYYHHLQPHLDGSCSPPTDVSSNNSPVIDQFNSSPTSSPVLGPTPTPTPIAPISIIQIPVPSSVIAANSCSITGRVIVSTKNTISVWAPVYNSSTLVSYFDKIFDIQAKDAIHVAIYENYIAYSTKIEAKVLYLNLYYKDPSLASENIMIAGLPNSSKSMNNINSNSNSNNNNQSVNNGPSEIVEDEHYFEITFDLNGNPTGRHQIPMLDNYNTLVESNSISSGLNKLSLASLSSTNINNSSNSSGIGGLTSTNSSSNSLSSSSLLGSETLGPINDIDHGINVNSESGYSVLSSTLLLLKKFPKDDEIHTFFFLPDSSTKDNLKDESSLVASAAGVNHHNSTPPMTSHSRNRSTSNLNIHLLKFNNNKKPNSLIGNMPSSIGNSNKGSRMIISNNNNNNTTGNSKTNNNSKLDKNHLLRCVISTAGKGFIYNLSKPSLLASYEYANDTILCTASQSFLYTINSEGLATWTIRSCEGGADDGDSPQPWGFNLTNFLYPSKVAVVGDHLLLMSKFQEESFSTPSVMMRGTASPNPKKADMSKGKKPSVSLWGLYILHHTPVQSLYDQILECAIKNKERDDEVYHQLLLEGHFLLQSKLANQHLFNLKVNDMASILNYGVERKNYQSLLKKSSSYLGEFFFKQEDYMRAALWYSSSDSDIETIFNLLVKNTNSHQSLIYYLENVLYDPQTYELLLNKEELCNRILEHYHLNSPHRLPMLILESSISCYSQVLAIDLLKIISEQCDFDLDELNKIYFALGLLYLDQNNIDDTITCFNKIPTNSLISLCLKNPKLLAQPGESSPTALCKILRQSTPWGLLELTTQLVKSREITPEFGLNILLSSTNTLSDGILNPVSYHHNDYDLDSLLIKIYLEWFLNIYYREYNSNNNNGNNSNNNNNGQNTLMYTSTSSISSSISMIALNEELLPLFIKYLIHLYVQDIHRFRGSDEKLFQSLNLDVSNIIKNNSGNNNNINNNSSNITSEFINQWIIFHLNTFFIVPQWLSKLPPFTFDIDNVSAKDETKYLLSSLYYKKLQSVLSINKIKDFEFMETIELIFSQDDEENLMLQSLKLACLPLLDRIKEAIDLVVNSNVSILLDYCLHFCKSLSDWSIVLDSVLRKYQDYYSTNNDNESITSQEQERETIIIEYEKILDHLSSTLDPESFLHLLPSNGRMDYFLSFIEKSFSNHQAKLLRSNLFNYLSEFENDN
ncbi:hypothetical protein CYY_004451 [Polysphondylium violaceum]|uniref:BLOC-2 complex member HPS3 C-terminal domain-containing protein n=1 Tax=Polysphondylium violaceum TaxID=133409 RepID=A0A8J4PVD5_9MYCE|nr:hypothetical protein CYY_004451 [Polysphondylium violaceum]